MSNPFTNMFGNIFISNLNKEIARNIREIENQLEEEIKDCHASKGMWKYEIYELSSRGMLDEKTASELEAAEVDNENRIKECGRLLQEDAELKRMAIFRLKEKYQKKVDRMIEEKPELQSLDINSQRAHDFFYDEVLALRKLQFLRKEFSRI